MESDLAHNTLFNITHTHIHTHTHTQRTHAHTHTNTYVRGRQIHVRKLISRISFQVHPIHLATSDGQFTANEYYHTGILQEVNDDD